MPASPELTEKITNAYVDSITTRLRWIVVLSIVSLVFSVIIVLHSQFKKPTPTYFAVNKKGQIMQLAPLKHPVYSAAYVSQYVTDALLKTFIASSYRV